MVCFIYISLLEISELVICSQEIQFSQLRKHFISILSNETHLTNQMKFTDQWLHNYNWIYSDRVPIIFLLLFTKIYYLRTLTNHTNAKIRKGNSSKYRENCKFA